MAWTFAGRSGKVLRVEYKVLGLYQEELLRLRLLLPVAWHTQWPH